MTVRLNEACEEFNAAAAAADERSEDHLEDLSILPAVKLYSKFLSTHAFVDGNGRVCFLILQYALIRMGLLCVALGYEEHQAALGFALRADGEANLRLVFT